MPTPLGGLRPALIVAAAAVALFAAPATHAAACNDRLPLHAGSCGQRVKDLQWLLGGHRPNVFTKVKATFKWAPNGAFGARTKAADTAYKYRLGYPRKGQCGAPVDLVIPTAGRHLFNLLTGKQTRPACWVALAAARLKAVIPGPSKTAVALKTLEQSQLGVTEQPFGSNRGPHISYSISRAPSYQSATGAYGAAWCVSFAQWALKQVGYGTFAQATAGVYFAVDYAAARNWLSAKAKVGELVAFITYDRYGHRVPGTGHMGFLVKVEASTFTYIAGNDRNAVSEHTIGYGSRPYAFIALPGVA